MESIQAENALVLLLHIWTILRFRGFLHKSSCCLSSKPCKERSVTLIMLLLLFTKPGQIFCWDQTVIQLEPEDPSFSIPQPIILDHLGPETLPFSLCSVTGWYIPPIASPVFELVRSSLTEPDLRGIQDVCPFNRNQLFVGSGFVLDALLGTFLWFVMCFSFLKIFLPPQSCLFARFWDIKVSFCYKVLCSFSYISLTHAKWCNLTVLVFFIIL